MPGSARPAGHGTQTGPGRRRVVRAPGPSGPPHVDGVDAGQHGRPAHQPTPADRPVRPGAQAPRPTRQASVGARADQRLEQAGPGTTYSGRGRLVGTQGLTGAGAVTLLVVITAVGLVIDLVRYGTAGPASAVGLLLGAVLAAARVRRRSLRVPLFAVPLVYLLVEVVSALAQPSAVTSLAEALATRAPALFLAVVAALLVTVIRAVRTRRHR